MAHVKQGEFKKIKGDYKILKNTYDRLYQYYTEMEERGNGFEFLDEMFSLDALYTEANNLVICIQNLLRFEKFEDNKNENEYKKMLEDSQCIAQYAFDKFSDIANSYRSVGLYDGERDALRGTAIGRDYFSKNNFYF